MDGKTLKLLVDLHINNKRQGPGSEEVLEKILGILNINKESKLEIVDIGCGTGISTISLLEKTNSNVTAVDFLPEFLEKLKQTADQKELSSRLKVIKADMGNLLFQQEQFDLIWSEGAIYNIGFEKGVTAWKHFLKKDGHLVLTEITWLKDNIPAEIKNHWDSEYPEIDTASNKIKVLEKSGYIPIGYFPLLPDCWLDNYYDPLQAGFSSFLERHNHSDAAKNIVATEEKEIALYKQYKDFYSYGVYIAKKI